MKELMQLFAEHLKDQPRPRILIVGSKPTFTHKDLGRFDLAFFANGAIARHALFDSRLFFNVLVESAYHQTGTVAQATWEQIKAAESPNSIVVQSPAWTFKRWKGKPPLGGNLHKVSLREKRKVVIESLGLRWVLASIWRLSRNLPHFHTEMARFLLRGQCSSMKPSTGVWTILLARHIATQTGKPCEIVVSGIGLSNDGYAYAKAVNHRMKSHEIDPHVINRLLKVGVDFRDL